MKSALLSLSLLVAVSGCGPTGGRAHDTQGDPNKKMDPNADNDGDGYSPNAGDCNDNDPTVHPGADELCDGKDHNCNMIVDDTCDDDKDGYNVVAGGPNNLPGGDCNDHDPLVNPGAMEVQGDMVDNNCDGTVDEPIVRCDQKVNQSDPMSYAGAFELCGPFLQAAKFNTDADSRARGIRVKYGQSYAPKQGGTLVMLSTGLAKDKGDQGFVSPQSGTGFKNTDPNPDPMKNNGVCFNQPDSTDVNDYVELALKLKVPTNAHSFSFNFMFVSSEYPEFVGTEFNDKFLAMLQSKSFTGNISFDSKMNPITVNAGFFDVCQTAQTSCGNNNCTKPISQLNGTGYEDKDFSGVPIGGGTGWLTTTAPVTPGEDAVLRFIIFDEGDHIYDSSVIIDNFQWQVEGSTGPNTIG